MIPSYNRLLCSYLKKYWYGKISTNTSHWKNSRCRTVYIICYLSYFKKGAGGQRIKTYFPFDPTILLLFCLPTNKKQPIYVIQNDTILQEQNAGSHLNATVWMDYGAWFTGALHRYKTEWEWCLWTATDWLPGHTVKWKQQSTDKYKEYATFYVRKMGK